MEAECAVPLLKESSEDEESEKTEEDSSSPYAWPCRCIFIVMLLIASLHSFVLRADLRSWTVRHAGGAAKLTPPSILFWSTTISKSQKPNETTLLDDFNEFMARCEYPCIGGSRQTMSLEEADAVVFFTRTVNMSELPHRAHTKQKFISFCVEASHRCDTRGNASYSMSKGFDSSLNYLRTGNPYPYVYGEMKRAWTLDEKKQLRPLNDREFASIVSKKTGVASALITHCPTTSKREDYIKVLRTHLNLTLRGGCYKEQGHCDAACARELVEQHYFYLALENAVCTDYVTEKFFDRISSNSVPVVLRRSVLQGIAPPDAFIAADDFESPALLAAHLENIAGNATLYRSYFAWRDHYIVLRRAQVSSALNGYCNLCRDLQLDWIDPGSKRKAAAFEESCEVATGTRLLTKQRSWREIVSDFVFGTARRK